MRAPPIELRSLGRTDSACSDPALGLGRAVEPSFPSTSSHEFPRSSSEAPFQPRLALGEALGCLKGVGPEWLSEQVSCLESLGLSVARVEHRRSPAGRLDAWTGEFAGFVGRCGPHEVERIELWASEVQGRLFRWGWVEEGASQEPTLEALEAALDRVLATRSWPWWLAPEQVRLLPVSAESGELAEARAAELRAGGLRTGVRSTGPLGGRVREAELQRVPLIGVIGPREAEAGTIRLRWRAKSDPRGSLEKEHSFEEMAPQELLKTLKPTSARRAWGSLEPRGFRARRMSGLATRSPLRPPLVGGMSHS